MMAGDFGIDAASDTEYWVVESIQYQVAVKQSMLGGNPSILSYSALVWATKVLKV
jgi:hypothetical protein